MNGMGETLKRKYGPLPLWTWLLLFVGLLSFFLYRRKKAQEAAALQADSQQGANPATNLGTNSLSNLVPQAYPMPFQQGDVFTNVTVPPPAPAGSVTTQPTRTNTHTPATPAGPKYPNQVHAVGQVGKMYDLRSYIQSWYPQLTPQQLTEVEYATIVNPKNKQYNLGTGKIPGGARIEIYSKAIK